MKKMLMYSGKLQLKWNTDRRNVSSVIQMSNLAGIWFRGDRSEGQLRTGTFFKEGMMPFLDAF